jgi:beta-galactosidase
MCYGWCKFNQWRVTDFFKFIQDEIHKYDTAAACHIRISVGAINQGRSGTNTYTGLQYGIDREALVRMLGINGLDNSIHDNGMLASSGRVYKPHTLYNQDIYSMWWLGPVILLDFIRSMEPMTVRLFQVSD